jgi:hypothetical protein
VKLYFFDTAEGSQKYMFVKHNQNAGQNLNIKIANKYFEMWPSAPSSFCFI